MLFVYSSRVVAFSSTIFLPFVARMEDLSGRQHLTLFARLKGVPEELLENAVNRALAEVNLTEKADLDAKTYSGGMKRRLSLAISLVADSKVIFLDEPSSGLDPVSRRGVWGTCHA